jgi:AraC-like DNA-binding protein
MIGLPSDPSRSLMTAVALHLVDPRAGDAALSVGTVVVGPGADHCRRTNRFWVMRVREGHGTFWADVAGFPFGPGDLLFAVPYQASRIEAETNVAGDVIEFHANFFCVETYHAEVGCNGVLFNDVYGSPMVRLDDVLGREFDDLLAAMRRELLEAGLAHSEILISYLKIMLVRATRLKLEQQNVGWEPTEARPAVLDELKTLVEAHFRTLHRPGEYAELLHLTPKSLAKLVKTHLRKTVTDLIRERVLQQAKWELLHTRKPVKQVAHELGFRDVFYFSRFFKRSAGCSPKFFRDYETEIRGGRNLSMP